MKLTLHSTRQEYLFTDESGYKFSVIAEKDDEWGWSATVCLSSWGLVDAESSVMHLKSAAQEFIRMLEDEG